MVGCINFLKSNEIYYTNDVNAKEQICNSYHVTRTIINFAEVILEQLTGILKESKKNEIPKEDLVEKYHRIRNFEGSKNLVLLRNDKKKLKKYIKTLRNLGNLYDEIKKNDLFENCPSTYLNVWIAFQSRSKKLSTRRKMVLNTLIEKTMINAGLNCYYDVKARLEDKDSELIKIEIIKKQCLSNDLY